MWFQTSRDGYFSEWAPGCAAAAHRPRAAAVHAMSEGMHSITHIYDQQSRLHHEMWDKYNIKNINCNTRTYVMNINLLGIKYSQ